MKIFDILKKIGKAPAVTNDAGLANAFKITRNEPGETSKVDSVDCIVLYINNPLGRVGIKAWADALESAGYHNTAHDVYKKLETAQSL